MQKQKYNASQILQDYFYHLPSDKQFKIKSLPSKYLLYRRNDQVSQLYVFVEGKIKMSIDNKQIVLFPPLLIGDYEPVNQIYKRITDIKVIKKSKFIVVPIELLFNLKLDSQSVILNIITFKSRALRYLFEKSLVRITCRKSDTIQLQRKIVFITEGVFQLSKFITLADFKKHKLQMKKNFDIVQFHPYQILFDKNLTCFSEKGALFSIQQKYYEVLVYYYQEFKDFYQETIASQILYSNQVEQIKNVYKHQKNLTKSFVPYIIAKQQQNIKNQLDLISPNPNKIFPNIKTPKIKSLSNQKYIDPNKTTFIQFLDRQEKQKIKIKPKKHPQRSNTQDLSKLRKQRIETLSSKISMQKMKRRKSQLEIPQQFMETKFKMRMFLRAKITFQSGGFRNPAQKRYSQKFNNSLSPRKRLILQIQSRNR